MTSPSQPRQWKLVALLWTALLTAVSGCSSPSATESQTVESSSSEETRNERDDPLALEESEPAQASIVSTVPLEPFYPKEALTKGTEGLVNLGVLIDPQGKVVKIDVMSESPEGMGFGEAARSAAENFTYANPTGQLTDLKFVVKFATPTP